MTNQWGGVVLSIVDFVELANCLDLRLFFGNLRSSLDTPNDFFVRSLEKSLIYFLGGRGVVHVQRFTFDSNTM